MDQENSPKAPFPELPEGGTTNSGHFTLANTKSWKHGAYSERVKKAELPEQAEQRAALDAKRRAIENYLGGREKLSEFDRDLVDCYLEVSTVVRHLGERLVAEGPLTAKGNQRATLTAYAGMVDRMHRLAAALDVQRKPNPDAPPVVGLVVERVIVDPSDECEIVPTDANDTLVIEPEDQ